MVNEKIKACIVTDAHQEKYAKKINKKIKSFAPQLDQCLQYYVCTDKPELIDSNIDYLKVFNLTHLQERDPKTKDYENISKTVKYRKYPWNLRRHIINKALEDDFDYVIWNDCDVSLLVDRSVLFNSLKKCEYNNVYTQSTIWNFKNNRERKAFYNCDKVIKDLSINIPKNQLITHDGPTAVYRLDKNHKKSFIESWDLLTLYGYESKYWNEPNWFIPNLVYVFAMSGVGLLPLNRKLFRVDHDYENRYE